MTLTFDHEHQIDFVLKWDRTGVSFTCDLLSGMPTSRFLDKYLVFSNEYLVWANPGGGILNKV